MTPTHPIWSGVGTGALPTGLGQPGCECGQVAESSGTLVSFRLRMGILLGPKVVMFNEMNVESSQQGSCVWNFINVSCVVIFTTTSLVFNLKYSYLI